MDILPTVLDLAHLSNKVPQGVEGGSLETLLHDPSGTHPVSRGREALVFHFPHYDHGNFGPATAITIYPYKLIKAYETNHLWLYDIRKDPGEKKDLAKELPVKVVELNRRLTQYLNEVNAQFAQVNPEYDPSKQDDQRVEKRNGGRRGRQTND